MDRKDKIRLAFYVTGSASRLIKIIKQYPQILENTFLVINDESPNPQLSKLLGQKGIEYYEFSYEEKGIDGKEKNTHISDVMLRKFNEHKIDYSFCFGGKILKGKLLEAYKNKIINFHPSILPLFPGVKSIDKAIKANSFLLGNTAHFIDQGMDSGPIIMQSIVHNDFFTSYDSILDLQLPMIKQIYSWLIEDRLSIKGEKVSIKNASNKNVYYYPNLENNS